MLIALNTTHQSVWCYVYMSWPDHLALVCFLRTGEDYFFYCLLSSSYSPLCSVEAMWDVFSSFGHAACCHPCSTQSHGGDLIDVASVIIRRDFTADSQISWFSTRFVGTLPQCSPEHWSSVFYRCIRWDWGPQIWFFWLWICVVFSVTKRRFPDEEQWRPLFI